MYLRLINVKAIERQRDSYILVINNRYEKMGESLYRINKDALEIIRNLNGTKTFDDLVDMMISCHLEKKEQAKYKLNNHSQATLHVYPIQIFFLHLVRIIR